MAGIQYLVSREQALPGRTTPIAVAGAHHVSGHAMEPPFPEGMALAMFAMGCFWGAERLFWQLPGVWSTAVGYAAGHTPNPHYEEVCSGRTGHAEVVRLVFDPQQIDYPALLNRFWEGHNPTQGMRQGNDIGSQYRSGIYCYSETQLRLAERSRDLYQQRLSAAGMGDISTEIMTAPSFYFAEPCHQQYLAKNPGGYCGLGGCGVGLPDGWA